MTFPGLTRTSRRIAAPALVLAASFVWAVAATAGELIEATRNQDAVAVQTLLAEGADPNQALADGATALHWAVHRQDLDIVNALIAAGADVNAANRMGASPLFIAARSGHGVLIDRLLQAGANPNQQLLLGETPLMSAARSGTLEGVRSLINAGAEVNAREKSRQQTALMWAASQGHIAVAQELISAGADLQAHSLIRPTLMYVDAANGGAFDQGVMENLGGYSPLLFAVRNGHADLAQLLIDSGADVNAAAGNGASPLVVATHSGQTDVALMLLGKGADPDSMGAGYSALHAAILRGDLEIVEALLAQGANPDVRVEKATPVQRASEDWVLKTPQVSATPYWLAAYFREASIMKLLADYGADPLATNKEQFRRLRDRASRENPPGPEVIGGFASALQAAVRGDSTRDRYYVQANPDPVGEERRALESVMMALNHGVDPDHTDFTGTTALHDAAARNLASIVRELAGRGADLNALNARGQTPLDMAIAAERRQASAVLVLGGPESAGPSAKQVLEELGALRSSQLSN